MGRWTCSPDPGPSYCVSWYFSHYVAVMGRMLKIWTHLMVGNLLRDWKQIKYVSEGCKVTKKHDFFLTQRLDFLGSSGQRGTNPAPSLVLNCLWVICLFNVVFFVFMWSSYLVLTLSSFFQLRFAVWLSWIRFRDVGCLIGCMWKQHSLFYTSGYAPLFRNLLQFVHLVRPNFFASTSSAHPIKSNVFFVKCNFNDSIQLSLVLQTGHILASYTWQLVVLICFNLVMVNLQLPYLIHTITSLSLNI